MAPRLPLQCSCYTMGGSILLSYYYLFSTTCSQMQSLLVQAYEVVGPKLALLKNVAIIKSPNHGKKIHSPLLKHHCWQSKCLSHLCRGLEWNPEICIWKSLCWHQNVWLLNTWSEFYTIIGFRKKLKNGKNAWFVVRTILTYVTSKYT